MIGKRYKTRYSTIIPKGVVGECIDIVNHDGICALFIRIHNKEQVWFLSRDLEEVN